MANKLKENRFMGKNIGKKPVESVKNRNNLWLMAGGAISLCIVVIFVAVWFVNRPEVIAPYSSLPIISTVDGATVVATVNGIDITAADVHINLNQAENMLQWDFMDEAGMQHWSFDEETGSINFDYNAPFRGSTFGAEIRSEAVRLAANGLLRQHYALQNNIFLTAEERAFAAEDLREWQGFVGGANNFYEIIRAEGFTGHDHFLNFLELEMLENRIIDTVIGNDQLFAQFEEFMPVTVDPTELANQLLVRAHAGEDFDMLIREYGEDPGMWGNPDGYTFVEGVMVDEFYEATKALAIGEISGLVPSMFGYHIIKRVEPDLDNVQVPGGMIRPATDDDYVLAAKHILLMFDSGFDAEPRLMAIMAGFNYKLENAEIIHLPELQNIVMGRR
jgi:hypothetical protein